VSRFIDEHRARCGVEPICRILGVSASAYYQRATGERSARWLEDERLLERIRELHEANSYAYGVRRMWKALTRADEQVGRSRVERLMRQHQIEGAKRRGKPWRTTTPDGRGAAPGPGRARFHCGSSQPAMGRGHLVSALLEGWCSWRSSSTPTAAWSWAGSSLPTCAPRSCWTRCGWRCGPVPQEPTSHSCTHSDRGSQYTSTRSTQTLDDHGVLTSVGSLGDAYDNHLAESFLDRFKTERIADRIWRTRGQLELATVQYIGWFNHQRLHEALGDIPPTEYELLHQFRHAAATD
jgi:transposase InsO family protein